MKFGIGYINYLGYRKKKKHLNGSQIGFPTQILNNSNDILFELDTDAEWVDLLTNM